MFAVTDIKRTIAMCCRMLISRAYSMAGVFGCMMPRPEIIRY